jgi:hypothetical protein
MIASSQAVARPIRIGKRVHLGGRFFPKNAAVPDIDKPVGQII